jgi:hypothetical protein
MMVIYTKRVVEQMPVSEAPRNTREPGGVRTHLLPTSEAEVTAGKKRITIATVAVMQAK